MENQLNLNSEVFRGAVCKTNKVIQETMRKLEAGNFQKAHILVTIDIRPTYKDEGSMLIDVDHKVTCTMKEEIKTDKDTSNSDTPIKKIGDAYVEGENPQMRLPMDEDNE